MNRYLLLTIAFLLSSTAFAQIIKQGETFTTVTEVEDKVVFLKEIDTNDKAVEEKPYQILQKWVRANYSKDHFYSSIRYDDKDEEVVVKSRVELILPENTKATREKVVMKFRINAFIFKGKCVVEIRDISYIPSSSNNRKSKVKLPRMVDAKEFISDVAVGIDDDFKELRNNTKKSTLFFINELTKDLESKYATAK